LEAAYSLVVGVLALRKDLFPPALPLSATAAAFGFLFRLHRLVSACPHRADWKRSEAAFGFVLLFRRFAEPTGPTSPAAERTLFSRAVPWIWAIYCRAGHVSPCTSSFLWLS